MSDLLKRADELDDRLAKTDLNIEASIEALTTASDRNRRLINWVIISIIVEAILAFAVIFVVVRSSSNSIRIQQTQNSLVNNCRVGNEFRSSEASLWNYILSIPPQEPPTAEQTEKLNSFKVFLDKTFAPRDCNNL